MEITTLIDKITELGSVISPGAPIDLRIGTSPGLGAKIEEKASQNGRSKPTLWAMTRSVGSMSARTAGHVDHLAEDQGVGDPGHLTQTPNEIARLGTA